LLHLVGVLFDCVSVYDFWLLNNISCVMGNNVYYLHVLNLMTY